MPQFEDVSDTVYVKSSDGGSVRIRSACDTGDDSNILTYASPGTALKRTGKGEQWTRIDYNGTAGYISSGYITTQVPETAALPPQACVDSGEITLNPSWKYAEFSKINSGAAVLYRTEAASPKGITVCVNAGHGTKGGASVKTQCHPDGTPKVTGGTTGAGATSAAAVSGGMTFADGTPESKVTLSMAKILKDKLLAAGYDVLMIRESDDVQLDNIARTVIANNASDCHIALHWDSTTNNKGAFYMSVPNVESYRSMEPVKSHWQQHNALGESLVAGLKGAGVKIFSGGSMAMDLTQTSFSTVPSVDIELGDKASDHSSSTLATLADGLVAGVNLLCPMTAYAAQSQEALELYKAVEARNQNMTDMNAFYDFKMKMSGSLFENEGIGPVDMRLEMNMKMNHIQDPSQMRYMAYCRMTIPESEPITYSMYYLDGYIYMDMLGQKVKYPVAMGDMMNQALASSKAFDVPEDLVGDFSLWDEGENKVIGYTINDAKMNEYMQMVLGSTGLTGMLDGLDMKLYNIRGEYVVNPAGDCIKMRLKMDMDMTMQGETFSVNLDGDVGIADPGQPVDVPVPNPAEYTDIQAAAS